MQLFILGKDHKIIDVAYSAYRQIFSRFYWKYPSLIPSPRMPHHIDIELTNRCNLACPHCHGRIQKRPIGNMEVDLFKKLFDEIDSYPFSHLHLCGLGEPTLHPEFSTILDYIRPSHTKVSVTTNGLLFEKFAAEQIMDWNLDLLSISVDGFNADTYHYHRPGGDYQRLMLNLQKFHNTRSKHKKKYPIIRIANVLFPDEVNIEKINQFRNDWMRFSDMVSFTSLMPIEKQSYDMLSQCTETFFGINVRWNGWVPTCGYHGSEWIGDVNCATIKEIFAGRERRRLQECQLVKDFDSIEYCKTCFFCQSKEKIANSHKFIVHKSKFLTTVNVIYRKLNLGRR